MEEDGGADGGEGRGSGILEGNELMDKNDSHEDEEETRVKSLILRQ